MLGLKSFRTAAVVISGIELAEKIKKGQFKIGKLCGPTATMPEIWRAHPGCVGRLLPIDEANSTDWVPVRDLHHNLPRLETSRIP
jgi:hypothetical protein